MPTKLGHTIRNLRNARGLTMLELSKAAGCDKSMISYIESSTRTPGLDLLAKIALALGVPTAQLLS